MVISEKALVQGMKNAFKAGGYNVICRNGERTVIMCPSWAVEIDNDNMPREVLSLLALHMGYLPESGDACKILKADKEATVQTMLFEDAMITIRKSLELPLGSGGTPRVTVKKTTLTLDGYNVWQKTGNQGIVLVAPEHERILRKREDAAVAGRALYKEGEASRAWIFCYEDARLESQLNHLGQILWVAK